MTIESANRFSQTPDLHSRRILTNNRELRKKAGKWLDSVRKILQKHPHTVTPKDMQKLEKGATDRTLEVAESVLPRTLDGIKKAAIEQEVNALVTIGTIVADPIAEDDAMGKIKIVSRIRALFEKKKK